METKIAHSQTTIEAIALRLVTMVWYLNANLMAMIYNSFS